MITICYNNTTENKLSYGSIIVMYMRVYHSTKVATQLFSISKELRDRI